MPQIHRISTDADGIMISHRHADDGTMYDIENDIVVEFQDCPLCKKGLPIEAIDDAETS